MSVGHICNVVLGGLENICTEWVFTCFFSVKQTISTSCLVYLKFIFIILFYFTYYIFLIYWCYQLCANVSWQNFVGLHLSMKFALCYISGNSILRFLLDFWIILWTHDLKNSTAHLQPKYLQLHLLAEVLLFQLVFLCKIWILLSEFAWLLCATPLSVLYNQCTENFSHKSIVWFNYHGRYVHDFIQSVPISHSFYFAIYYCPSVHCYITVQLTEHC